MSDALEALARRWGWDADARGENGEPCAPPDEHIAGYVALLESDLDAIDAALGLAGEGRTRFYGDRLVRVQSLLRELDAYRNAAKVAKLVR